MFCLTETCGRRKTGCTNIQIYKCGHTFIPTWLWKWRCEILRDTIPGLWNQNKFS
jgi:hypothetical protein